MTPYILIDPGHGGIDPKTGEYVTPGKRSPKWPDMPQLFEGEFNRDVARRLSDLLAAECINHSFTVYPDDYRDVALQIRTDFANALHAGKPITLFLSIHGNGHSDQGANGLESFCFTKASRKSVLYNEIIYDELHKALPFKGRGTKAANLHVLRETNMPAVLVELGFMTNRIDCSYMNSSAGRDTMAQALFKAIKRIIELE